MTDESLRNRELPPEAGDEPAEAVQIDELLGEGYSPRQIVAMGFARSTVYDRYKRQVPPQGEPGERAKVERRAIVLPAKLGARDMVPPETSLRDLRMEDGSYKDGMVDGINLMLITARYNQILAATQGQLMSPVIDLVKAMREEEKLAAEQSRGEGAAIAREAAQETALKVINFMEERLPQGQGRPDIASVPDPLAGVLARTMEAMLSRLVPGAPGAQGSQGSPGVPPGWSYREEGKDA